MKKISIALMLSLVVMVLIKEVHVAEAACNPTELSSCASSVISAAKPSRACCSKLRKQKACLCGYLKDPNLRKYVNFPNARKAVSSCGITLPQC
ncbi:hypothetical protein Pint_18724 [Pistacia integerrima]|uniref:Uncharacterized protein n=1 Tax=Pistacia integerrima TaxID=434235 RepID=A0ACC0YU37_9ROSI|nr:hypothetical protein Pint_18724 [Pistacia integerrima]